MFLSLVISKRVPLYASAVSFYAVEVLEKTANPIYHSLNPPEVLQIRESNFIRGERRGGSA